MGVEVAWRLIKAICSELCYLSQFIAALCKFIRTQLGEEHMDRLRKAGDANAFIIHPKPTKEMYGAMLAMHPKTLSGCWIIATYTKCNADLHHEMVEEGIHTGIFR